MKNKNTKKNKTAVTILLLAAGALAIAFGAGAESGGAIWIGLGIAIMAFGIFAGLGKGKKKDTTDEGEHSYVITSTANVDRMEGHEFEYFCAELLERCGFEEVEVTRGSGDQGVDILAKKEDIRYAIQCKNYSTPLGNTPVQEVYAGKTFYRCHVGVVMTNSTFTKGAVELADSVGVILWDKDRLDKMMVKTGMQEFTKNKDA
jgi:HJR/Mrr/RecB family endonuclease